MASSGDWIKVDRYRTLDGFMFDILMHEGIDTYNLFLVCLEVFERGFLPYLSMEEFLGILVSEYRGECDLVECYRKRKRGEDFRLNPYEIDSESEMLLGYVILVYSGAGKLMGVGGHYCIDILTKVFGIERGIERLFDFSKNYMNKIKVIDLNYKSRVIGRVKSKLMELIPDKGTSYVVDVTRKRGICLVSEPKDSGYEMLRNNIETLIARGSIDYLSVGHGEYFGTRIGLVVNWILNREWHKVNMLDIKKLAENLGYKVSHLIDYAI